MPRQDETLLKLSQTHHLGNGALSPDAILPPCPRSVLRAYVTQHAAARRSRYDAFAAFLSARLCAGQIF
jgi:hypothetical protein